MKLALKRINKCIETKSITLDLSYLKLSNLPEIPPFVQTLRCSKNQLKELPALPASLQRLYCSNNQLKELPAALPTLLQTLNCSNNQLTELPASLPTSLHKLNCSNNQYLYISQEHTTRLNIQQTPNYNEIIKPIQRIWKAKKRLTRLKFLSKLQQHIDEFRFRPGNSGYHQVADRNKNLFI